MKVSGRAVLAAGVAALTGGALAQSDDCGNATQIAGYGTYSFNTSSASDSSYSPCAGMGRDVFWAWTAQATANVTLSTCGASFDTVRGNYAAVTQVPLDLGPEGQAQKPGFAPFSRKPLP